MFHLAAFSKSLGIVTDTQVDALADDILSIQNGLFFTPQDMMLCGAYCQATDITRAKLASAKLLQTNPLFIRPVNLGAEPLDLAEVAHLGPSYPVLRAGEQLQLLATKTAAGPNVVTGLVWLSSQLEPIPQGEIYTIRATSTGAAVANAWTTIVWALDTQLPAGQYAMVGSSITSAGGIAHRFIFDNQAPRAGHLSMTTETFRPSNFMRYRTLGVMGRFIPTNLPRLQVLCATADVAHTMYLDVIRVGNQ